jgi:hypothetical protein
MCATANLERRTDIPPGTFAAKAAFMTILADWVQRPAEEIGEPVGLLASSLEKHISNVTRFTNIERYNLQYSRHLARQIYIDRTCSFNTIHLIKMPPKTIMFGGSDFLVAHGGRLVSEQVSPVMQKTPTMLTSRLSETRPEQVIEDDVVIVARFGIFTWGHWLGELLPRAVLVESMYGRKFKYVVPRAVAMNSNPALPWVRIREALQAYGIGVDRLLLVHDAVNYIFYNAHLTTPVWSDFLMHPDVSTVMRGRLVPPLNEPALRPHRKIAIVRGAKSGRQIHNKDEVAAYLTAAGFELCDLGGMAFCDQLSIFRSAKLIFATLGSDLTGLIFAPVGVGVISAAPPVFGDRFFYALVVDRQGIYADLRGPVVDENPQVRHKSSFELPLDTLATGVRLVTSASSVQ